MLTGHAAITGLSLMVTLNEQLELPATLVAVQVTNVVPAANVLPEAGEQTTVGVGVPVAVGVANVATALHNPASLFLVIFAGQAPITGPSLIVTVNEQLAVPQVLVAEQLTVVVPDANVEPEAGEQPSCGSELGHVHGGLCPRSQGRS